MFSTKEKLSKRTGKSGVGRLEFLTQLVDEYEKTKSASAKEQVIANLANFAYDPINYEYLRRLKVIDIFLNALNDNNIKIIKFSIGGICNLCLDPIIKQYMLRIEAVCMIIPLIFSADENIILSTLTTILQLLTPDPPKNVLSLDAVKKIKALSLSSNQRLKNLALIFLEDFKLIHKEVTIKTVPHLNPNSQEKNSSSIEAK